MIAGLKPRPARPRGRGMTDALKSIERRMDHLTKLIAEAGGGRGPHASRAVQSMRAELKAMRWAYKMLTLPGVQKYLSEPE